MGGGGGGGLRGSPTLTFCTLPSETLQLAWLGCRVPNEEHHHSYQDSPHVILLISFWAFIVTYYGPLHSLVSCSGKMKH